MIHRHQLSEPEYEYSIEQIIRDPSYNSKVEFALKLGYTEAQLQRVLLKIGHSARENQVRRGRIYPLPLSILLFNCCVHLSTNLSAYRFSDTGGAHPTAKVEARIRVGAPADDDDAQGGPSDAAAVGGDGPRAQEGKEGPAYADPVHARVAEPAYREVLYCSLCNTE